MNAAMRDLTDFVWKQGGFRFTHTGTNFQSCTYQYHCSQDLMHVKSYRSIVEVEKQRDGRRMTRFPCQSKLNLRPCLQNRTLSLSVHHIWHMSYEDIELSPSCGPSSENNMHFYGPLVVKLDLIGMA
jgi:hypothetical protein